MTDYVPFPRHHKRKWLLTDGRIVEEPNLEQSPEGRRIRVAGSDTSVYAKELDDLIYRSVTQFAENEGERVWMRVSSDDPVKEIKQNFRSQGDAPTPHFIQQPSASRYIGRSSSLSWTFRHDTLPIAAQLTVSASENPRNGNRQTISVEVNYPSTNPYDADSRHWMNVEGPDDFSFSDTGGDGSTAYHDAKQKFYDSIRDYVPQWVNDLLGTTTYANEREAAAALAKLCRTIEEYETITIPDLRDPAKLQWMEVGLYDTNYSSKFLQSIIDFVNGQPIAEELATLWGQMVEAFRRAGIVVDSLEESDFSAALQGETDRVVASTRSVYHDEGQDEHHVVGFDVATGTITVTCSNRDVRPESVAAEYEIARIRAEARGELDAFLAFEERYIDIHHDKTHNRIVKSRTVDTDDLDELLSVSQ